MNNRFVIKNLNTGKSVQSEKTAVQAIHACRNLNDHAVNFCGSFARYIVIDGVLHDDMPFYSDLDFNVC